MEFKEVVSACEYMGEIYPIRSAWVGGPVVGLCRVEYVNAHKAHAKALESGDTDKIDSAWAEYCHAQNAFINALYGS